MPSPEIDITRLENLANRSDPPFLGDVKLNPFKNNPRNLTVSQARQLCESRVVVYGG